MSRAVHRERGGARCPQSARDQPGERGSRATVCGMPTLPLDWVPPRAEAGRVFTAAEARAAGATPGQVRHRLASGAWVRVAGHGLRLAEEPEHRRDQTLAAWLTWPDGVVCRESALRFHLAAAPSELTPRPVHMWVPSRRRAFAHLVPHRFTLPAEDVEVYRGGRVTTLERAALDALAGMRRADADRLLAWLLTRQVITRDGLEGRLARHPRMWGNQQLRELLADTASGALSAAERLLHRLLVAAGITGWRANVAIRDGRGIIGAPDVLFPAERVVIEVDGRAFHGAERFQHDRERRNRLVLAGYVVLNFTWQDLTARPEAVVAQVRAALASRRRP